MKQQGFLGELVETHTDKQGKLINLEHMYPTVKTGGEAYCRNLLVWV